MVQDNKPNMRKETLSEVARSVPTTRYNTVRSRPSYSSHRSSNIGCGILAVATLGLASMGVYGLYEATHPTHTVTATVTDKVRTGGDNSKYLIFTDKGVFENTDSLVNGKWNSSDLYGQTKIGKTYTFTVRGLRVHFLSWYPNIVDEKPVK